MKNKIKSIPLFDSHCHVMERDMGRISLSNTPHTSNSQLAALMLHFSTLLLFKTAGITENEIAAVKYGEYSTEECKKLLLPLIEKVEYSIPFQYMVRGLNNIFDLGIDTIDKDNWCVVESALDCGYDNLKLIKKGLLKSNICGCALNMWESWGYSRYCDPLYKSKIKNPENRYFCDLATFDSYAVGPDTPATLHYAKYLDLPVDTFEETEIFYEKLAQFFVEECHVSGFKVTEAYYRPLDYKYVSRGVAQKAFSHNMNIEDRRIVSNYFTWRVFELAEHYNMPVQIHTGERWGDSNLREGNPTDLLMAVQSFPKVKFDLLHGSYPYMAELGALACNNSNVWLNLSYMFIRSLPMTQYWLDTYMNIISNDHILLGSDVFDIFSLSGVADGIRDVVYNIVRDRVSQGWLTEFQAVDLAEKLLNRNAINLYNYNV